MAKKSKPEGKKYSYMDTYGDLVTLLLCFFVLLFAMSTVEENKFNAFVQAMNDRFSPEQEVVNIGGAGQGDGASTGQPTGETPQADPQLPADLSSLNEEIQQYIEENNLQDQVSVEKGESSATFIRLSTNMLFAGNRADLRPETLDFLMTLGAKLNELDDQILRVKFIGHTASIPGSAIDDWKLSAERAGAVASFFDNNVGFTESKIAPSSHGRTYPIADNNTPEGMARNRRVDIIVIPVPTATSLAATILDMERAYFPSDDTSFYEGDPAKLPENIIDDIEPVDYTAMSEEELRRIYNSLENGN